MPWRERPALAIASCGNAAIAAATLAQSQDWPIEVFVPPSADEAVLDLLASLGADIVTCPRTVDDPPGDPCVHRFREAVADGAVPFSVQGTENVWCLDGGRTIGWEMADVEVDRLFVQVGGGALAACAAGAAPLWCVQTWSSAPLVRAWERATPAWRAAPAAHWGELMWPWEDVRPSAADGILDDETYDWIPVVEAMQRTGGGAIEVSEDDVRRAGRAGPRAHGDRRVGNRVRRVGRGRCRAGVDRRRRTGGGDPQRRPPGLTGDVAPVRLVGPSAAAIVGLRAPVACLHDLSPGIGQWCRPPQ